MYQFSGKELLLFENKTELDLIDYLTERYKNMNIQTQKQYFQWRNIIQANVIAFIPADRAHKCNEPVLLIDHIDTAFQEDTFYDIDERRTTQDADDNVSDLIALFQSVSILKEI